ncbi:MAG: polyprenyl diphosphate synthase, partial [Pseudomonadota bacterium]
GLHLVVAVAYGGRWDMVQAAQKLCRKVHSGELDPESIDERALDTELAMSGIPDPDLLIRTGGEKRISNFLLWNLAYSELFFTDELWPDFRSKHLDEALEFYAKRQRRYGNTPEQLEAVKC